MKLCNENTHTDRIDVSFEIALNEYGIVRNPKTNDTVFCLNPTPGYEKEYAYQYTNFDISYTDVKEVLKETEEGYFSYIGSDRETALRELHGNCLAHHIFSLNQYNGYFSPFTY